MSSFCPFEGVEYGCTVFYFSVFNVCFLKYFFVCLILYCHDSINLRFSELSLHYCCYSYPEPVVLSTAASGRCSSR